MRKVEIEMYGDKFEFSATDEEAARFIVAGRASMDRAGRIIELRDEILRLESGRPDQPTMITIT